MWDLVVRLGRSDGAADLRVAAGLELWVQKSTTRWLSRAKGSVGLVPACDGMPTTVCSWSRWAWVSATAACVGQLLVERQAPGDAGIEGPTSSGAWRESLGPAR